MEIFVKSRGNLREQDYIYWQKCENNCLASSLSNAAILNYFDLVDDTYPGLLLFYKEGYYHLLIVSLDSTSRREPSSPNFIRNAVFWTRIKREEEARILTIYALENWDKLANKIDSIILVTNEDENICGYELNCSALFEFTDDIIQGRESESISSSNKLKNSKYSSYGGVNSQEWEDLAEELRNTQLPNLNILILITNRLRRESLFKNKPYRLLCNQNLIHSDKPIKNYVGEETYDQNLYALGIVAFLGIFFAYLVCKYNLGK